jgi:hypothetical protein
MRFLIVRVRQGRRTEGRNGGTRQLAVRFPSPNQGGASRLPETSFEFSKEKSMDFRDDLIAKRECYPLFREGNGRRDGLTSSSVLAAIFMPTMPAITPVAGGAPLCKRAPLHQTEAIPSPPLTPAAPLGMALPCLAWCRPRSSPLPSSALLRPRENAHPPPLPIPMPCHAMHACHALPFPPKSNHLRCP